MAGRHVSAFFLAKSIGEIKTDADFARKAGKPWKNADKIQKN